MSSLLAMSQPELTRLEVIQRVKRKTLRQRQAAELLSLSVRQVKRLCKAYQAFVPQALISKRRGQPSNNRLPEKTTKKARRLLRTRYHDFGPTLAQEKLTIEGLTLSVESVRQLLITEGLWQPRRARRPVIHQLRERRHVGGNWCRLTVPHTIGSRGELPSARCWCLLMMPLRD